MSDVHAAHRNGPASEPFSAPADQPEKYRNAGTSVGETAAAVRAYTAVLRRVQADAGRAVMQFEQANQASERSDPALELPRARAHRSGQR